MLNFSEIKDMFQKACQEKAQASISFTCGGKWRVLNVRIREFSDDSLTMISEKETVDCKIYQPVGICVQVGYYKYLFESTVQSIEQENNTLKITLDYPEKVDQMQRRAFERREVPASLKVKALFWHRGYMNEENTEQPAEQYWQGRLLNLSAGGAQIVVDNEQSEYFHNGQIVGVQFTPMSYQKPLLLEGHIRYLMQDPDQQAFRVGVEFLGLEASPEGRETMHRLVEITNEYERITEENNHIPA